MAIPLNKKEKDFMRKMLKWDQKKASFEVIVNNIFLAVGMLVTLYVAYRTFTTLNDLQSLWLLLPGYIIGILLLSIFIVGDVRIKERRKYASVMRKILLNNRKERA
ncbi:MAG: hypothetical protein DRH89_02570 [Candidatus Cloacimonadota bacterium]|nr:MAG: hypothetical protein DRH89_02570 [Candidatus Cloacimonadota bacterium]